MANGMLTGKKIFFLTHKNNSLKYKIIQILIRLEAIVEPFFNDQINMIIIDDDPSDTISLNKKRKSTLPLLFRSKKMKLIFDSNIETNNENDNEAFLAKAISMGCKVKSLKELWSWFNKFYSTLVENCYNDDSTVDWSITDANNNVKSLLDPSVKILDPLGNCKHLNRENCQFLSGYFEETSNILKSDELCTMNGTGINPKSIRKSRIEEIGYCECCKLSYTNLYKHLNDECHQTFATSAWHFNDIDKVVSKVSDINVFFANRLSQRQRYQDLKTGINTTQNNNSEKINLEPDSFEIVVLANCEADKHNDSSSSSDSSNSCSYDTDSSSTSSSNDDVGRFHHEPLITSTPSHIRTSNTHFSLDSLSNEDIEQSQLSQHVHDIVNQLSDTELPFLATSNIYQQSCIASGLYLNEEPPETLLLTFRRSDSLVLSPRFNWCQSCGRNHVPINDDQYQCNYSPPALESSSQVNCDMDEDDYDHQFSTVIRDHSTERIIVAEKHTILPRIEENKMDFVSETSSHEDPLSSLKEDNCLHSSLISRSTFGIETTERLVSEIVNITDHKINTNRSTLIYDTAACNSKDNSVFSITYNDDDTALTKESEECHDPQEDSLHSPNNLIPSIDRESRLLQRSDSKNNISDDIDKENISALVDERDMAFVKESSPIGTKMVAMAYEYGLPFETNDLISSENYPEVTTVNDREGNNSQLLIEEDNTIRIIDGSYDRFNEDRKDPELSIILCDIANSDRRNQLSTVMDVEKSNSGIFVEEKSSQESISAAIENNDYHPKQSEHFMSRYEKEGSGDSGNSEKILSHTMSVVSVTGNNEVTRTFGTNRDTNKCDDRELKEALMKETSVEDINEMRSSIAENNESFTAFTFEYECDKENIGLNSINSPIASKRKSAIVVERVILSTDKRVNRTKNESESELATRPTVVDNQTYGRLGFDSPPRYHRTAAIIANLGIVNTNRPSLIGKRFSSTLAIEEKESLFGEVNRGQQPRSLRKLNPVTIRDIDRASGTSSAVVDSPSRQRRSAAIDANRGIQNTNRLARASIEETIRCIEKTQSVIRTYDPRISMTQLQFSPKKQSQSLPSLPRR